MAYPVVYDLPGPTRTPPPFYVSNVYLPIHSTPSSMTDVLPDYHDTMTQTQPLYQRLASRFLHRPRPGPASSERPPQYAETAPKHLRFALDVKTITRLTDVQLRSAAYSGFIPSDDITFSDINQLDEHGRADFLLENLALICLCIRDYKFLELASDPPTVKECKYLIENAPSSVQFICNRISVQAQTLAPHRAIYHSPMTVYNEYEKRLHWTCTLPLCHANLLRPSPTSLATLTKQSELLDKLDDYAALLTESLTANLTLESAIRLTNCRKNIFRHEIKQKYSHLKTVLGEAFNSASLLAQIYDL